MNPTLSTQDIMLAVALIFGIATACQLVAPRLRIPALVLLLPAGFLLGLLAPQWRADALLGPAFPVIVDLVVAVILFQGGLGLAAIPLPRDQRNIVRRLIYLGAPVTWLGGAVAAHLLLGMDWSVALMLGALLIVSGPTVVTPILDSAHLKGRVQGILQWEGTLLDPLGALVAVVVFQIIKASNATTPAEAVAMFLAGLIVAVVAAAVGVVLFVIGGHLAKGNKTLGTQVLLGSVIVTAGLANSVTDDSGLLAALLMGMAAPRIARRFGTTLAPGVPFFDTIVSISIGVLFVAIAGLVPSPLVLTILLPTVGIALFLMLVVRPVVAAIATSRTELTRNERIFIGWMAPRGIVAAATASSVGAALVALSIPDAAELLPAAFIVIAVTVTTYGLTAVPVARKLGLHGSGSDSAGAAAPPAEPSSQP